MDAENKFPSAEIRKLSEGFTFQSRVGQNMAFAYIPAVRNYVLKLLISTFSFHSDFQIPGSLLAVCARARVCVCVCVCVCARARAHDPLSVCVGVCLNNHVCVCFTTLEYLLIACCL